MITEILKGRNLDEEFVFSTSRSSGPGGQNINKVNTKVELRFNVLKSKILTDKEKSLLSDKLKNRINIEGELIIVSQTERSQLKNKKKVIEKFYHLLSRALTIAALRVPTAPSVKSKEERLEEKRRRSIIKKSRSETDNSSVE